MMRRDVVERAGRPVLIARIIDADPASPTVGSSVTAWRRPLDDGERAWWTDWLIRLRASSASSSPSYGEIQREMEAWRDALPSAPSRSG